MKKRSIRLFSLLLVLVMVLGLTACGKNKNANPNAIDLDDYSLVYKGARIMEDGDGNAALVLTLDFTNNSKEAASYLLVIAEEAEQNGTFLNQAWVFTDYDAYEMITDGQYTDVDPGATLEICSAFVLNDESTPVDITFSLWSGNKEGTLTVDPTTAAVDHSADRPDDDSDDNSDDGSDDSSEGKTLQTDTDKPSDPAETDTPEVTQADDPLLNWWNGSWYGWWCMTSCSGDYEELEGYWWDCAGEITIGEDYTGLVELWDEDGARNESYICSAEVTLNSSGTGEHGTMFSESGFFMDAELAHADWIVDPGLSVYDNMIIIEGWYEGEEGDYDYSAYLRPWGQDWSDIETDSPDNLPYYYYDWYLPLIESDADMPDAIGGEISSVDSGGSSDPSATSEPTVSAEPVAVTREIMDRAVLSLKQDFVFSDVDRSDIVELLGTEGAVHDFSEDYHWYSWQAPENVILLVGFDVENGEETTLTSWSVTQWDGAEYDVEPVALGSRPEGTGALVEQSYVLSDFFDKYTSTVSFTIPEGSWCVDDGFDYKFLVYNNPTTDDIPFHCPYISFQLYESAEKIDTHKDEFENLQELGTCTIGGVTMNARSYKYVGMDHLECYGQVPGGGWISICVFYTSAYTSADNGTECGDILNSVSFS